MTEGFGEGLRGHLFHSFSLVFTIGGTIVSLIIVREYWWISLLFVAASYVALGTFAYRRHRELDQAQAEHRREQDRLRAERQEAVQRAQEAERKLNEVPANILAELQRIIGAHSFKELAGMLVRQADFVERMTSFTRASPKPISLRTFTKQGGGLYALAKVEAEAAAHVRIGDSFLLIRRAANGLETTSARLLVHQLPEPGKDVLMFRIVDYLSDELGHIDRLAQGGDVEGMKGYRVRVACDVARYGRLDMHNLAETIEGLANEIGQFRGRIR